MNNTSTDNFSAFTLPENDIIVSLVICFSALFFLVLYLPIVFILIKVKKFSKSSFYILFLSASISDTMTLCSWILLAGTILIRDLPPIVSSLPLAMTCLGWRVEGWHLTLLALNRYVAICHHTKYKRWFSIPKVRILIMIAWMHGILAQFIPPLIPPMIYFEKSGYYMAISNENVAQFFMIEDEIMSALFTLTSIICYTLTLRNYHISRRRVQATNGSHAAKERAEQMKKFRLFWQMFAASMVYLLAAITFYLVWWIPVESVWATFASSTVLEIVNAGFGAAIFLTCNKEIKGELKKVTGCSMSFCKSSQISPVQSKRVSTQPAANHNTRRL